MAFELGGKVCITCDSTGYEADLEFKLKPFFSLDNQSNLLSGKLKYGNETIGNIDGKWDSMIYFKNKQKHQSTNNKNDNIELFWSGYDEEVRNSRLKRFTIPIDEQMTTESQRLWLKVTYAIQQQDQQAATVEKTVLEEEQRDAQRLRQSIGEDYQPKLFHLKESNWCYKMADNRPWNPR